jgi:hypothetical protein
MPGRRKIGLSQILCHIYLEKWMDYVLEKMDDELN